MSHIQSLSALEILDSRGNPTVQVCVTTNQGVKAIASVPSGASTGQHEAVELRDGEESRYKGKGVTKAIEHIMGPIADLLVNKSIFRQRELDTLMLQADGTLTKEVLGANAMLAVSLGIARSAAKTLNLPLYAYLGGPGAHILPCPMLNILNGGQHADNGLAFQEFMVRPIGAPTFREAIRWGSEIFHVLKSLLKKEGYATSIGDEGGFAPRLGSHEAALDYIVRAIESAGYRPGDDVTIALDCAASSFYDATSLRYEGKSVDEQIGYLASLVAKYPIDSIEDGLDENDWKGWHELTQRLSIQLVGDDIFVTNPRFLQRGIAEKVANAILIKPNQIGTLTETLDTIALANRHGYRTIISHRSGETEDTFIADLAVATGSGQIKTGAPCRGERTCKYNRLLAIEAELSPCAAYNSFRL